MDIPTPKELRLLRRIRGPGLWHASIKVVEGLQRRGWMIQLERPLHEPPCAYVEYVHEAAFDKKMAEVEAAEAAEEETQ